MTESRVHRVGVIMNGVTGRMGRNQHLQRSIAAIIRQGGVKLSDTESILPDPLLVGRNPAKLKQLSDENDNLPWTTDLDTALADSKYSTYFDAQSTGLRAQSLIKAIAAGKHVYSEKPSADCLDSALDMLKRASDAGIKHGVVQDKLWLPGLLQLRRLKAQGFFGRILSVRGEYGYWVFEGDLVSPQRPSWNYRKEDGGGMILDMVCHWRYLLDNIIAPVTAVSCVAATAIAKRWDETGDPYVCTADDSAYLTFELEGGVIAQVNCSSCVRVRRDDLLTIQVDGTQGSAVATPRHCWIQPYSATPRPVWNPDLDVSVNYSEMWQQMPENDVPENAFKRQWELFLRHVARDEAFPWNLLEGAKGVQLAELAQKSWVRREWVSVPALL